MKIKKLIILFILILLTGCSANYTVTLNENNSVSEKLVTKIEDSDDNYYKILNLIKENKINKKNYKIIRDSAEISIEYEDDYTDINEYLLKSKLYKQLFDEVNLEMKDSSNIISTKNKFSKETESINKDNISILDYMQININSKLPVIYSNADSINNNVYSWIYDGSQNEKNISFSYKRIPTFLTVKSIVLITTIIISIISIGIIIYKRMNSIQQI